MAKVNKYGIASLRKDFPTDDACLDFIFESLHSRECSCGGTFHRIKGRKKYQCSKCRHQIAPTSGTIFHKSDTPLTLWFHALLVFSNAKSGISVKEMERQLEVTYKCAWRILSLIRKALRREDRQLWGTVEADAALFGGVNRSGKNLEFHKISIEKKARVIAAVERGLGGEIRTAAIPDLRAKTQVDFIQKHVEKRSRLLTDRTTAFSKLEGSYYRS